VGGKKIGVLGGTFDPIHVGHLLVARDAMDALELDRVIFVPASIPPHKLETDMAPAESRLAMVRLAIGDDPDFSVSEVDFLRSGPSFSIDTVKRLQEEFPGNDLFFLIGEDNLGEIWSWKDPERLFQECRVIVIGRPGGDRITIPSDIPGPATALDIHRIQLSSSEIREKIRQGRSIRYLVPREVERYIYEHRLYHE
jgi:nicotinate-nucleotide adenylyltransferase